MIFARDPRTDEMLLDAGIDPAMRQPVSPWWDQYVKREADRIPCLSAPVEQTMSEEPEEIDAAEMEAELAIYSDEEDRAKERRDQDIAAITALGGVVTAMSGAYSGQAEIVKAMTEVCRSIRKIAKALGEP